jgi:chromosome segregation ATPase
MKQVISKEEVAKAIGDLMQQGKKKPTLAAIHAALNHRGSMSTLVRLKNEIDAAAQPATDSPDGLKAFREVWALAVDEGRQQQEAVLVEVRETVKALAEENERLEGALVAAQNRADESDAARSRAETELHEFKAQVEGELKLARTAHAKASARAAEALQMLAADRAAHAVEVANLQQNLAAAVSKAHEMELKVVRAETLLGAKRTQASTVEAQPAKASKAVSSQS